eukprot:3839890-Amphidinium_carterae.1
MELGLAPEAEMDHRLRRMELTRARCDRRLAFLLSYCPKDTSYIALSAAPDGRQESCSSLAMRFHANL